VIKLRADDHSAGFVDISVFITCSNYRESFMELVRRVEWLLESDLPWLRFWRIFWRGAMSGVRVESCERETNEQDCLPDSHRVDITPFRGFCAL